MLSLPVALTASFHRHTRRIGGALVVEYAPPAERLLDDRAQFSRAARAVEALVSELDTVSRRFILSQDQLTTTITALHAQSAVSTSRFGKTIQQKIIGGVRQTYISSVQASRRLQSLCETLGHLEQRAARCFQNVEEGVKDVNSRKRQLRVLSQTACNGHWTEHVPLAPPSEQFAQHAPSQLIDGFFMGDPTGAGGAQGLLGAGDSDIWRWNAIEHNKEIDALLSAVATWDQLDKQRRKEESACARVLIAYSEELSHALPVTFTGAENSPFEHSSQLTAEAVRNDWESLGLQGAQARAYAKSHCFELAGLEGLPPEISEAASQEALRLALKAPEKAYAELGFLGTSLSVSVFRKQVENLQRVLSDPKTPNTRLIRFGRHNNALTAAVSVGDLATAERVLVVVPGMSSTVGNIESLVRGSDAIYRTARAGGGKHPGAVVAWMGYESPGPASELGMMRAHSGSLRLAAYLDSSRTQRTPPRWLGTVGHSYGSTTSAEALKIVDQPVDSFLTIGSAGLASGTTAKQLRVKNISAISADAPWLLTLASVVFPWTADISKLLLYDAVAPIGKGVGGHAVDPRTLEGARTVKNPFLINRDGIRPVAQHGIWAERESLRAGYLSENTASVREAAKLLQDAKHPVPHSGESTTLDKNRQRRERY
jgi:hypothetical protein